MNNHHSNRTTHHNVVSLPGRDTCNGACETAAGCHCTQPPGREYNTLLHRIRSLRGCEGPCEQGRRACTCHLMTARHAPGAARRPDCGPDTVPLGEPAPSAYRATPPARERRSLASLITRAAQQLAALRRAGRPFDPPVRAGGELGATKSVGNFAK